MPKDPQFTEYGKRYYSDSLSKEEQKALHKWRMKNDMDYKNQIAIERKKKKATAEKAKAKPKPKPKTATTKPKTSAPKSTTPRVTTRGGMGVRGGGAGLLRPGGGSGRKVIQ